MRGVGESRRRNQSGCAKTHPRYAAHWAVNNVQCTNVYALPAADIQLTVRTKCFARSVHELYEHLVQQVPLPHTRLA